MRLSLETCVTLWGKKRRKGQEDRRKRGERTGRRGEGTRKGKEGKEKKRVEMEQKRTYTETCPAMFRAVQFSRPNRGATKCPPVDDWVRATSMQWTNHAVGCYSALQSTATLHHGRASKAGRSVRSAKTHKAARLIVQKRQSPRDGWQADGWLPGWGRETGATADGWVRVAFQREGNVLQLDSRTC